MSFTATIAISAPVERVWHCIEDPEQRKRWQQGLEETVYTHVPQHGGPVGTRFVARIRQGGRLREFDGELVAHQLHRLLVVRADDRHLRFENTYRLTPAPGGTRLEFTAAVTARSLPARLLVPLAGLLIHGAARRQLRALKALAEGAAMA